MVKNKRPTVYDLTALKGKRTLIQVHVRTTEGAAAASAAGIDIVSSDEVQFLPEWRTAAPNVFFIPGLAYGLHATPEDCIRAGFKLMNAGADAIYCAASTECIRRMYAEGIPVVGHVGLVPSRSTWTGGFRAVGKTAASATQVWQKCIELQDAGVFAIEVEVIPERLAREISSRLKVLTFGMGTGTGCDSQYLFSDDILGTHNTHYPKHAKRYRDFFAMQEKMQQERVAAFCEFKRDVETGIYPQPEHIVPMADEEFEAFIKTLKV